MSTFFTGKLNTLLVNFGPDYAGRLSDTSYTLKNPDGTIFVPKTYDAIVEVGGGIYYVLYEFVNQWTGYIEWDIDGATGVGFPVTDSIDVYFASSEPEPPSTAGSPIVSPPIVPHFTFPFNFGINGHALTVEQDSDDEILQGVRIACLTPRGSRYYVPNFGIDDLVFTNPSQRTNLLAQITQSEPRATYALSEQIEDLVDNITIGVGNVG